MNIEESILNDPQCAPYVDKQRKWIHEAFMDGVNWAKQNGSIPWQTGIPKEKGIYLVTTIYETIATVTFCPDNNVDIDFFDCCITAWCKTCDIIPYKNPSK